MPGAARSTTLKIDQNAYGDGYIHRATRGLNPAQPSWTLQFPFIGVDALIAYDDFLRSYSAGGFWFTPPDASLDVFATCDSWATSITDKSNAQGIVGTLQATFAQAFNPQPYAAPVPEPPAPIQITGNAMVGSEAHERGVVQSGTSDAILTFAGSIFVGTVVPWIRLGPGNLIFAAGGNGQLLTEFVGYDRAWGVNSSGTAWVVQNSDGNTPIISIGGDLSGPG